MPAGRAERDELRCSTQLREDPSGPQDPLPAVRSCLCPPTAQRGALQTGPRLFCWDTCGCGLCPLGPPVPALCDLSAVALGEQLCREVPGAGSSPQPLPLRGEKSYFQLQPPFQSGAFLEPQGRKGRGLASLPPSAPALSFCSSRRLPMALPESTHSACPYTPFFSFC